MSMLPKIAIATLHQKDRYLAPEFSNLFDCRWEVITWNTDSLGTFSGEVSRPFGPEIALEKKLQAALDHSDAPWVIASEGSYFPLPSLPLLNCTEEHLWIKNRASSQIWKQKIRALAPFAQSWKINLNTNLDEFFKETLINQDPLQSFILTLGKDHIISCIKGINNLESLKIAFSKMSLLQIEVPDQEIYLVSDLRAHQCPGRQKILTQLAEKMSQDLIRKCPHCEQAGFYESSVEIGLPCELCGSETSQLGFINYTCPHCSFIQKQQLPGFAKSNFCFECNP